MLAAGQLVAQGRVVLISIDGLKGSTLASLPARKLNTPNLNEFVEKGAVSEGLAGVFPTVTYPSHTTIVTGRSPAAHGILGNTLFDPERTMNGAWYWYAEQIRVPALWDAARQKSFKTAAVSWPVTVGAQIDYNIPEFRFPRTIEDKMLLRLATTPGLLNEYEAANGEVPIRNQDDMLRARMAAHLMRTRKPDLLLVHLMDMDHDQHGHGPDAPEALKTLEKIDECIGMIRKETRDPNTVFVVVSDHGFWPVAKALHPVAILRSLDLAAPDGQPAKWKVAVHGNAGSFALIARQPDDLESIALATKTFQRLRDEKVWGVDKVLLRDELDAAKAHTGAFLAVSMASGFTVGYGTSGAWLTPSGNTKGNHGYWPGPPELDAAFVAFGAGIAPRKLPRGKLVDVAPTAAKLLGVSIADMEGQNLLTRDDRYPAHWWTPLSEANKPDWEILPQAAKPGEVILSKRNELGILSNFALTPFTYKGKRYASVEGFWQMMLYPEGPDDPRAKFAGVKWPHTREEVAAMTAFTAKSAGTAAEANMKKMGIDWVTFEGKRIHYRSASKGEHYRLIVEAMQAKLEQNPKVKEVLLSTGDLILLPDHHQEKDPPAEWQYFKIWMELRQLLQKAK